MRETLRFAALIKLPASVSRARKLARAEEVLRMLGLRGCADGLVGGELLKGISGGERRRLSLACAMVDDPAVLIVDEPVSAARILDGKGLTKADERTRCEHGKECNGGPEGYRAERVRSWSHTESLC